MSKRTRLSALLVMVVVGSLSSLWAGQKPTELTENCTSSECHNSYSSKRYVHEPVEKGVCKYCHKAVDPKKHSFRLFRTRSELCGSCHHEQTKGKYRHKPLEEGQCIECHNPHSSDYKFLVPLATVEELCRKCHKKKEDEEDIRAPHKPVTEGKCKECHKNHSSDHRALLISNERQLCFSCHDETKAELDQFKYIHKPVVDRGCGVCHEPHGSDYFMMLNKKYPPEFYAPFDVANYALCLSCHKADKILFKETEKATDFRNGNANLHYLHVHIPERGRTCRTCHATHASNEPKHLRKAVPFGGWEVPIQFEKTETGGRCFPGCHDPRVYDRIKPAAYKSDND